MIQNCAMDQECQIVSLSKVTQYIQVSTEQGWRHFSLWWQNKNKKQNWPHSLMWFAYIMYAQKLCQMDD